MMLCPFLSTSENDVECFSECAFYNWEDIEGSCPFKNLAGNKSEKIKDMFKLGFYSDESSGEEKSDYDEEIGEYYVDKQYIG